MNNKVKEEQILRFPSNKEATLKLLSEQYDSLYKKHGRDPKLILMEESQRKVLFPHINEDILTRVVINGQPYKCFTYRGVPVIDNDKFVT